MRTIKVWVGINKNGFVSIHNEQPIKDEKNGIWKSKKPFCNSIIQKQIEDIVEHSPMSWFGDSEYFEFQQRFSSEEESTNDTTSPEN